jgi:rhodanese-related sulfurtransferase
VHANRDWLAKNLDEHHVIIDVRDPNVASAKHIPSAVTMPAAEFAKMTQQFIKDQKVAQLPGVTDMKAPIIVYGASQSDPSVLQAFKEIRGWGYSNVSVLEGGLDAWVAAGLPTASNQLAASITYTKKLAEGAIPPSEFAELEKTRDHVTFVDVRTDAEVAKLGMLKGAMHIPLDSLENRAAELPKDTQIVTYCENGIRAEMAYQTLRAKGFNVRFLNETIQFDKDGGYSM